LGAIGDNASEVCGCVDRAGWILPQIGWIPLRDAIVVRIHP